MDKGHLLEFRQALVFQELHLESVLSPRTRRRRTRFARKGQVTIREQIDPETKELLLRHQACYDSYSAPSTSEDTSNP